jgi:RNA polymerase sigma-70 factor, ECF subfamily
MAPVFMDEARRVVAGEAILSGATTDRNQAERSSIAGTDDLLETLVREHSHLVYRIAYTALRSHHDAEDATQETFLRVLRYKSKLPDVDDPKTWLARIAWRVAVDRSKRKPGTESSLDDPENVEAEPVSGEARADDTMQGMQMGASLERLIGALPAKLREPLILSTIEEMSPVEVAATLRINEAAVRSRIFRARQILKEKLQRSKH